MLFSISSYLCPKYTIDGVAVSELYHLGLNLTHLDGQAALIVHKTIANLCLLPKYDATEIPLIEAQTQRLIQYISGMAQDFMRLDHTLPHGQQEKVISFSSF